MYYIKFQIKRIIPNINKRIKWINKEIKEDIYIIFLLNYERNFIQNIYKKYDLYYFKTDEISYVDYYLKKPDIHNYYKIKILNLWMKLIIKRKLSNEFIKKHKKYIKLFKDKFIDKYQINRKK